MRFDLESRKFVEKDKEPEKLAVSGSDVDLSWEQFKQQTDSFTLIFKELSLKRGSPVLIYGHKQASYVSALTACIQNEIPYVPVDTSFPAERIKTVIKKAGVSCVINCTNLIEDFDVPVIISEMKITKKTELMPIENNFNSKDPLVYIIFTSGSTGEPKGVQITREAHFSFCKWIGPEFKVNEQDVVMNQAPFSFDLSVYELSLFLSKGVSLVLNSNDIIDAPDAFIERQKKYDVNIWVSTPSFAYICMHSALFNGEYFCKIKSFIFCGEELKPALVRALMTKFPASNIYNTYGPTEATVAVTSIRITTELVEKYKSVPIGVPLGDNRLFFENLNKVTGEGELCICGKQVSIGYMNAPDLTKERFFSFEDLRAYRTGDLGYCKDGLLFYIGRSDSQVKLHGYRIEVGEIESVINEVAFVEESVVLPLKMGTVTKRLVGFFTVKASENSYVDTAPKQIFNIIKRKLPSYMLPSELFLVEKFPKNQNFKIDRKALFQLYSEGKFSK